jgi:hypothetical protein
MRPDSGHVHIYATHRAEGVVRAAVGKEESGVTHGSPNIRRSRGAGRDAIPTNHLLERLWRDQLGRWILEIVRAEEKQKKKEIRNVVILIWADNGAQ